MLKMRQKAVLILAVLLILSGAGIFIYRSVRDSLPANSRAPGALPTNVSYGIFGEYEKGRGIVEIDAANLITIIESLQIAQQGAMPCGYDYYLKIYRTGSSNFIIEMNTECKYLTIHSADGHEEIGLGEFYSLSGRFFGEVKRLISELATSRRYLYKCRVSPDQSYEELSAKMAQGERCFVLKPDIREDERNPFISIRYSDKLALYPKLSEWDILRQCELGELEPDKHFNMLVYDSRLENRIASLSPVMFRESTSLRDESTFIREMKVYIKDPLSEVALEILRKAWEGANGRDTFRYSAGKEYTIEIITDKMLMESDIVELKKKYSIREIF
jgi:hypothetical protein